MALHHSSLSLIMISMYFGVCDIIKTSVVDDVCDVTGRSCDLTLWSDYGCWVCYPASCFKKKKELDIIN